MCMVIITYEKWHYIAIACGLAIGVAINLCECCSTSVARYRVDHDEKDTPERFTEFLDNCTLEERVALMQSLRGLKQEIGANCYGKLAGLATKDGYAKSKDAATAEMPLLPETYNDVSPIAVADAMAKGHLSEELVSPVEIKKQMVWRRYNKLNYVFHEKDVLDYHRDYVMWAASKCGVSQGDCEVMSTYYLEQEIYKKKFADIWDKLGLDQRTELLSMVEKSSGSVGDKIAIASMSGAGAIAALSASVAFSGFAFYSSITTGMAIAAGWVGVTLPFAAYTATTTTIGVVTGPIGWCVAGAGLVGGCVAAGWPDSDLIISFVMTVNVIKAKKLNG